MNGKQYLRAAILTAVIATIIGIGTTACGPAANNGSKTNSGINSNIAPITNSNVAPITCADDQKINLALKAVVLAIPAFELRRQKFNFDSKGCVVYLSGWMGNTALFKELEKLSLNVNGVTKVDKVDFWVLESEARLKGSGGCVDPYQDCGDICIPKTQTCNTKIAAVAPGTPTPTP